MKKRTTLIIGLTVLLTNAFAQTKLIAHKSHSGSKVNFKKSLVENLFDVHESNFGDIPMKYVRNSKLDSVIFISEEKVIMITSKAWHYRLKDTTIWKPGREIVRNHPLLSKQHALDSIKLVLKDQYYFTNPVDSVVFLGYDNFRAISKHQQENSLPLLIHLLKGSDGQSPFGLPMSLVIIVFFVTSILFGLIYSRWNKILYANNL